MSDVRLRYVADVIAGQSPPADAVTELESGLPFIQGNAEFGSLSPVPKWQCEVSPKIARPGDTLVSVRAPVGAINFANQRLGIGRGVAAIRPKSPTLAKWIFWTLTHKRTALISLATGSTFTAVASDDLANLRFPRVPNPQLVADYLDHETAEIDAFIADLIRLIELTGEHTRAKVAQLMSGENRGDNQVDQLRSQLGRVISINRGQVDPRVPSFAAWPLIAPNHVESRTGRLLQTTSAQQQGAVSGKYVIRPGQIVYSKIRPALMKATRVDFWALCSADMYAIDANPRWLSNDYLLEYLLTPQFESFAVAMSDRVAMPKLNRESLAQAPISLPSVPVQQRIAASVREARKNDSELKVEVEKAIEIARERRAALVSAAVTGELDVTRRHKPVAEQLEDEVLQHA